MHDVRAIANWVLDVADRQQIILSNMSINKLVYFIVERFLVKHGELITDAKIEAWQHGPVFRELYQSFKPFGDGPITSRARSFDFMTKSMMVSKAVFSNEDEQLMQTTLDQYLGLSASHLRALSHRENGPWHKVWWHEAKLNPGMEISADTILKSYSSEQTQ
jgi:uncharacterized phage-associated protein